MEQLTEAMGLLAQHPKTLFVGQSVAYDGQAAFKTFSKVPVEKRIEMPVAEDFQMGFCTGLALQGFIPICFFPRFDFLLLAANQLINHLDKIPMMSGYRPKVIIRTAVGSTSPLNPGPQHIQDHTQAFKLMLNTVEVVNLHNVEDIVPAYQYALESLHSQLLIEYMGNYH